MPSGRERVEHHRDLAGAVDAVAALAAARLRAVDEAGRVQADRPDADARAGAAHEVAVRVEQHLVGVDVGVVVRHLHRVRVEVEQAGHERAHDEPGTGERLVHRRRLVDAARRSARSRGCSAPTGTRSRPSRRRRTGGGVDVAAVRRRGVVTSTSTSAPSTSSGSGSGPRRSRSENGAPSASCPVGVRYLAGGSGRGCGGLPSDRSRLARVSPPSRHPAVGRRRRRDTT